MVDPVASPDSIDVLNLLSEELTACGSKNVACHQGYVDKYDSRTRR